MLLGADLAWFWIKLVSAHNSQQLQPPPSQGSFLLAAMVGNTDHMGYSVALVGPSILAGRFFTIPWATP
jgi:hypothetical protein